MPTQSPQTNRLLVPTTLPGVLTHTPLPDGVHPSTAPNELLQQHGFPMRPDPRKNPRAAKLWRLAMSRFRRHIIPELRINHNVAHGTSRGRTAADTNNSIWSGKLLQTGGPFIEIWGSWTIPLVQPSLLQSTPGPPGPFSAPLPWKSAIWVGIDGWNTDTVFQAGTEQDVRVADPEFGTLGWNTYAWFEWFSDKSNNGEIQLMNFPVNPGDSVLVYLVRVGVDDQGMPSGQASFLNLTGGAYTSVIFSKPNDGSVFQGNCAEWIVERPSNVVSPNNLVPADLADFGAVTISSANAKGPNGIVKSDSGTSLNMFDPKQAELPILSETEDEPTVHCVFGSDINQTPSP